MAYMPGAFSGINVEPKSNCLVVIFHSVSLEPAADTPHHIAHYGDVSAVQWKCRFGWGIEDTTHVSPL